ncbi:MAG: DNA repair protein RecN [Coriobacteriia bacterium]
MLEELHVRDLALIKDAWLEFGPGMTVLTGETGAGKTVLLGALKLLLGERSDSSCVRSGEAEAVVEGRFFAGGEEVVVRRRVSAEGRSRCTLDGDLVTVTTLAERVGPLVDLHGQHEHQALLSPATHLEYFDRWAGEPVAFALRDYREAWEAHRAAVRSRDTLRERVVEAERTSGYLRFVAEEIGRVDPAPGEDDALTARLPALQHAEKLAEAAARATELLRGSEGAGDRIGEAAALLARVEGIDPALDALVPRLAEAQAIVDDIGSDIRSYRDGIEHDPRVLDDVLGRLSQLGGLVRKYGPTLDDVLRRREEALASLSALDSGEAGISAANAACEEAEAALRKAADALTAARKRSEQGFVERLGTLVADLAMDGASFEISFAELPFASWTADGPHKVEFLYSPAVGLQSRPLARIASGGEISRVMLAMKGVLGEADSVGTLVFDEIDTGIGGAAATAVGRRLKELAETHQVIVVTHLAQVAAFAERQLVVSKCADGDSAETVVEPVLGEERVREIARMLSGNESEASLAHARELLSGSR